jgi:quercetin dioxygenase-like cupin family protein
VFYVLKGTGVVEIGEEKETVSEGSLVESPKDIVHCWYNESDEPMQFMVIKAPKPTGPTKFLE